MKIRDLIKNHEEPDEETEEGALTLVSEDNVWSPETLTFYGPSSRSILVSGPISDTTANAAISQILSLTSESETLPIFVYINTDGGEITAGLAIYDMMRITPCPVVTIVMGKCHSAGLFILQGGDKRVATTHASFFYHEPISGFHTDSEQNVKTYMDLYKLHKDRIEAVLQTRAKISKTTWKKFFDGKTAFYFDTTEALNFKLIDEVIDYAKPKPIKVKLEELQV